MYVGNKKKKKGKKLGKNVTRIRSSLISVWCTLERSLLFFFFVIINKVILTMPNIKKIFNKFSRKI